MLRSVGWLGVDVSGLHIGEEQKEKHVNMCQDFQQRLERDPELPCDFSHSPKTLKLALKGRRFNVNAMIQVKLWGALGEFQTTRFTQCLEWCRDCQTYCTKSKGNHFETDSIE